VAPQDPQAMSRAVAELAEDAELRRRYADAGRAKAGREFLLPAVARSQATVYERLAR
jgi:glycosyltransferase involved in cell wall biosynthesis